MAHPTDCDLGKGERSFVKILAFLLAIRGVQSPELPRRRRCGRDRGGACRAAPARLGSRSVVVRRIAARLVRRRLTANPISYATVQELLGA